jgi:catechol 2,3-dioxygenase-like lactoylglutathione lyase family enzyme
MSDIAHLGPVELLTPAGDASLRFFVDVMGMEVEHQEGAATYVRGWGDYQPWSLKLIASDTSGMGVLGLRTASPEALARRVALVEAAGLGEGWVEGDRGRGTSYRFRDPDGHRFELYYACERYDLRPICAPRSRTCRGATRAAAARSSGSTT